MADFFNQGGEAGGSLSKYNEASLKMMRLSALQSAINVASLSPLAFSQLDEAYNFEIIFRATSQLFSEVYSKLSDEEKKLGKKMKEEIENFMEKYPIYSQPRKSGRLFYPLAWKKLNTKIYDFDLLVRDFLDKHKFGAPEQKDVTKAAIDM